MTNAQINTHQRKCDKQRKAAAELAWYKKEKKRGKEERERKHAVIWMLALLNINDVVRNHNRHAFAAHAQIAYYARQNALDNAFAIEKEKCSKLATATK